MVQARLAELQNATAKKSEVTVESLLAELEHARERADSLDQLSASVKAIEAKAKVSGLLAPQKIEITSNSCTLDLTALTTRSGADLDMRASDHVDIVLTWSRQSTQSIDLTQGLILDWLIRNQILLFRS